MKLNHLPSNPITGGSFTRSRKIRRGRKKHSNRLFSVMVIILSLALLSTFVINNLLVVEPAWPDIREGDPVPKQPNINDSQFNRVPLAETFDKRKELFLEWASEQPSPDGRSSIWGEILLLEGGQEKVSNDALQWSLDFVNQRNDCADFVIGGLIRLYYLYAGTEALSDNQEKDIKQAILDFMYWLDEPNPTGAVMELYTENHQIMAHSSEYLAGQLFPQETFTNVYQNGKWRMDRSRPKILNWIDWRSRTGMAEWDSIVYYPINFGALLNLVDFAGDDEISTKASMMVDLLLFDMVVDSFYGQYSTSHGRIVGHHVKSAAGDSLITTQALLWGLGRFQSTTNMAAVSFATSTRYELPPVLEAIAIDVPGQMKNLERHSINVTEEDAQKYGLSFTDIEDAPLWFAMGVFLHPKIVRTTVQIADKWDLWQVGGDEFAGLKTLARVADKLGLIKYASSEYLGVDFTGVYMTEVNKKTYGTPDYMLSSAQDYRKGEKGYQQHIWQATLGPYAVVFANNPDSLREDDRHRPSYWAGNGRLPRTVQHENLLISIFDIDKKKGLLESRHFAFTHAYFPRWAFDKIEEIPRQPGGGWIVGKKDNGYVALYSHLPYQWQEEGPDAGQEVIALGRQNVWICLMGRRATDGTFDQFVNRVRRVRIDVVDDLQVKLEVPYTGDISFGWDEPFLVNGKEIQLRDYPRWDNPYLQAEFNSTHYVITHGTEKLELDFIKGRRLFD